ncbi:MAG: hypothetical protein WC379_14095 [Methanoregula sp.]|jgi:type IV secretory pathway VirB6-like protein
MTWDKKVRAVAWACFGLMWISLAIFIIRHPQEPTFEDMFPVFAFLALLFVFIILLVISTIGPLIVAWRESRFVRKYGTLVPAVVRDLSDTGIRINNQQMLEIALTVSPPYEPAFRATVRKVIPYSSIPQVQPGSQLQVWHIPGTTRVAMPE